MIEKMIVDIVVREGGYVNRLSDRGGPTKYGITIKTLSDWRKCECTPLDVKNLTIEEASAIYKENYINKPGIIRINDEKLVVLVFDMCVHSGVSAAIKTLQRCVGTQPDGILGAVTLGVIKAFKDPSEVRERFLNSRLAYLNNIIARDPTQVEYEKGWNNRIKLLRKEYV